jgi:hypothetical protein
MVSIGVVKRAGPQQLRNPMIALIASSNFLSRIGVSRVRTKANYYPLRRILASADRALDELVA